MMTVENMPWDLEEFPGTSLGLSTRPNILARPLKKLMEHLKLRFRAFFSLPISRNVARFGPFSDTQLYTNTKTECEDGSQPQDDLRLDTGILPPRKMT